MKLLVVDDDEDTSSLIRYVMEDEKHVVRTASAIAEARAQLREFEPDLIILDRHLPDQDGLDFCRELRGQPLYARTPVLLLTAAKTPGEVAEGLDAGGSDYVTKPFAFIELIARVQALLRNGEGRRPPSPSA